MAAGYIHPKKRLGQHYLTRPDVIQDIVDLSRFGPFDVLLEIGPGKGALTLPLARKVSHIVAIEKDPHLTDLLGQKISQAEISNITLINEDILKFDFDQITLDPPKKIRVIGNLPYNISSPCLEKLLLHRLAISRAVLMFQREFALRLCALPGEKSYGALTVLVNYYARTTPLLHVRRDAFYPRPKVDSTVIEIDFQHPYPKNTRDEAAFRKIVRGSFSHRRKTLINSLKRFFPSLEGTKILELLDRCGIDPRRRAETLDMDEYLCITDKLALTNNMHDVRDLQSLNER